MKTLWVEQPMTYTGEQLSSHWIYKNFGLMGNAAVAFTGPCDIPRELMVDLEDVMNDDLIFSTDMLHFIVEVYGMTLREGVLLQRLFSSMIQSRVNDALDGGDLVKRRGDDLFYQETHKLSVSICTVSPTSILIHTGLNIESAGAPVDAAGLISDLAIEDVKGLATGILKTLADEWEDTVLCCCKVRAVG
jgi:hypothetical protein